MRRVPLGTQIRINFLLRCPVAYIIKFPNPHRENEAKIPSKRYQKCAAVAKKLTSSLQRRQPSHITINRTRKKNKRIISYQKYEAQKHGHLSAERGAFREHLPRLRKTRLGTLGEGTKKIRRKIYIFLIYYLPFAFFLLDLGAMSGSSSLRSLLLLTLRYLRGVFRFRR